MTIERERPVRLPSQVDAVVGHLLRDLRAVKLPEPVRELHFAWCCEHPKADHSTHQNHPPSNYYPNGTTYERCDSCRGIAGPQWVHEYRHERNWRWDLCWVAEKLAIEVDGATWAGGRHTRGAGYENDCEKINEGVLRGWRVLRFTTAMVERGDALEVVERAFGRSV